jgi:hypothetical protein
MDSFSSLKGELRSFLVVLLLLQQQKRCVRLILEILQLLLKSVQSVNARIGVTYKQEGQYT